MGGLVKIVGIATLSLVAYTLIPRACSSYNKDSREEDVTEAIGHKDFPLASRLLDTYRKSHSLDRDVITRLELQVERARGRNQFDRTLRSNGADAARDLISRFEQSNLYDNTTLNEMKKSIREARGEVNDEALFIRIVSSDDVAARKELCETYLNKVRNGTHRREVVQRLVLDGIQGLSNDFEKQEAYTKVYTETVQLGSLLQRYANEGVKIDGIFNANDLFTKANNYINGLLIPVNGRPNVGDYVRVSGSAGFVVGSRSSYNINYLQIRDRNFSEGQIGRVAGSNSNNQPCVRFEGIAMARNWGRFTYCRKFWNDRDRAVAGYVGGEITLLRHVTDIDRGLFLQQVERLREGFTHYR